MDRTDGEEVGCHAIPHSWIRWRRGTTLFMAVLSTACIVFASDAGAQCSARDVLKNHMALKEAPSAKANMPPIPVRSAVDVPVWKTITIGTFANSFDLRNALDAASCDVRDSAAKILAGPTFALDDTKTDVELIAVSAAELGFQTDT
ncbi:MAG TPA: hypothetical protein VIM11_25415, partial [Tepidisphaeraceae bacterium]